MQTKRILVVMLAGMVCGATQAENKPAQEAKPAVTEAKKEESKKANTATVIKDVNTNITIGDVVATKEVKVDLTMRCMNFMETVQNYKKGAEISEGIEKKRQNLTAAIKKEEQRLTQEMTDFKSKESTMSTAARNNAESKIVKMRRDYEALVKGSEDELKLAMQQATEELSKDVEVAVAEIAKSKGYDMVVDTYSGRVVYASDKAMITTDLVKVMDKKYEVANNKKHAVKASAATA